MNHWPQRLARHTSGCGAWRSCGAVILLLAVAFSVPLGAAPLRITGDDGATLTLPAPPQRIIALAPNLTELAYAAGLGSKLVAVTAYSDYPPEAQRLPQVGDAFRLDWERLVALKPDLVLGWKSGLSARDLAMLHKLGLKRLVLEPRRLDEIPQALRLLGRVAGTEASAETAARRFEQQRDELHHRFASQPRVRAYVQIAHAPLLTVNGEHIISDVLRLCGASNVFATAPVLTPTVSAEALLAARPDILLALASTPASIEAIRRSWRTLPSAVSARQGFVDPDLMSRAGPRILQGAASLCEQVDALRAPGKLNDA